MFYHPSGMLRQTAVSPFRQRAAHNLIQGYIFNGYRRLSKHFLYWSIPFTLGTSPLRLLPHARSAPTTPSEVVFGFVAFIRLAGILMRVTGYGIYSWARSYDKWQNSKAAHVAGHGGH